MDIVNGLITAINNKQQEIVNSMVDGRFANFESYQRYVGIHQGLAEALIILNNLLKEEDKDE